MSQAPLRIAVIDENQVRAAILEDGLRAAGLTDITIIRETQSLLRRLVALDPDVVIIDLENPSRDVLEQMFHVSRMVSRPVAMFVDRSDTSSIEAAIEAGVSAYIVDGLRKERVKPILDMTISRFNAFSKLQRELSEARSALEERKIVERAKGILMKSRNLSEEDAYRLLRQSAMNEKKKLVEIAQSVVTAASLFGK
ncbi:ANTAR domain-containing response regulator [Methylobrevis pamukkalensis]|uniref:Putative transcriptional regulatory protein pdtaR n=1 Tax=Methylobrevis pamukkalensis TaxID=1439726 RepID=A0A1E3H394_9HYPH|nr:ANTAR domain-containing protein [Methylobrevis pamukkalensis]ODN70605.1 putative transcriptional regulatory protein pdtaR [Methylobrevis pamukkalensis]